MLSSLSLHSVISVLVKSFFVIFTEVFQSVPFLRVAHPRVTLNKKIGLVLQQ